MQDDDKQISIRVGFGDHVKELQVVLPNGDIPPYQPGDKFELVGQSRSRVDAIAKVTGRAKYTYDQSPPRMLHARILRCPHPNANVLSVDLEKARSMPGVKAVLSFADAFRQNSVRFAWDGVAAVAAETELQAEEAVRAIEVQYEPLAFCVTREDAMAEFAPQVGRRNQKNTGRIYPRTPRRRGGGVDEEKLAEMLQRMEDDEKLVAELLGESDKVIEGEFDTQVQTHSPLETHGVVCDWDGDHLIAHVSTQGTFGAQWEATHPRGAVRAESAQILCEYIGGGFGAKTSLGREGVAGALLAKSAGRPVKLMLDRREEHTSTGNRPDSQQQLKMGVNKDGTIVAFKARSWGTAGNGLGGAGAHNDNIYDLGAIDKVEYGVRTNCGGARALRAPGWPQGAFALEAMMDKAAAAIGMDPIEFRKKNDSHAIRPHQYDRAAEMIDWKTKRSAKASSDPKKRGVGIASSMWFASGGGGARVLVRIHRNGTVQVRNGAQDIGTGTRTIMGMVAAEELGLDLAQVQTFIGNTDDPRGPTSGGSTTAPTITPAARLAAHRAKEELLDLVAEKHDWDRSDLDLASGNVVRKDGQPLATKVSFKDACELISDDTIETVANRPVFGRRRPNYEGFSDTNAGVQCAEVEVDTETGEVKVLKVVAVQDAGKVINPLLAESQVSGGIVQGVSYALFERRIMDRQEGRMVNADFEGYKILGSVDCPEIEVELFDVYNGKNNTSVMGLGEPPVVATAAAVANAVSHAIGERIESLPITPAKVLSALERKERRG
ncbi:MAG: xanthine dehydrogenase family protein molybdopterin-binding subunit [Planctomycetota bacterium]